MYDWDETLIKAAYVNADDIEGGLRELTASLMHPDFKNTYLNSENWQANISSDLPDCESWGGEPVSDTAEAVDAAAQYEVFYNSDKAYPLTSHDGYTFGKWIEFDSPAFTIYGDTVRQDSADSMDTLPAPASPDYANMDMSNGIILKAAYIANSSMSELNNVAARWYTLYFDESPGSGYFERFATTSYYLLKVKIERKNSAGKGVHRPRNMALRVAYTINDMTLYSLVNLKNSDEQIAEIIMPNTATSVSFNIIDNGDFSNWVSGANSRNASTSYAAGVTRYQDYTGQDDIGFVLLGATYTANQIVDENSVTPIQLNAYINILFNTTQDNIYWGTDTPVNTLVARLTRVMTNIREDQAKKLSDFIAANPGVTPSPTQKYLSFDEMRSAVRLGGDNYLTPIDNG